MAGPPETPISDLAPTIAPTQPAATPEAQVAAQWQPGQTTTVQGSAGPVTRNPDGSWSLDINRPPVSSYAQKVIRAEGTPSNLGGFMDEGNFVTMARRGRPELASVPDDEVWAHRSDPQVAGPAIDALADHLASGFPKGVPVNDATKYAAHWLGPHGAALLYSANPNSTMADLGVSAAPLPPTTLVSAVRTSIEKRMGVPLDALSTSAATPSASAEQPISDRTPDPGEPDAQLSPNQGVGLNKGLRQPLDTAGTWLGDALKMIPGVQAGAGGDAALQQFINARAQATGMPAATSTQQMLANAAAHGQGPDPTTTAIGQGISTFPAQLLFKNPILGGAAAGALTTPDPNDIGQTALNAAEGAGSSLIGSAAMHAAGGAISPILAPAVERLKNLGVDMTSGQLLQGLPKAFEDTINSVPGLKLLVEGAKDRSIISLNRAAVNQTLAPIGQALPDAVPAGEKAIDYAANALSGQFTKALSTLPDQFRIDRPLQAAIGSARDLLSGAPEYLAKFDALVKANITDRSINGQMTPQALSFANNKLGYWARGFSRSEDVEKQALGQALNGVTDGLHDWVGRINPAVADTLNGARAGWANLVRVERAAAAPGAKGGLFSPSQFSSAVRSADNSARHVNIARGTGLMQQFADDAEAVLPNKVPDSGTIVRGLTSGALLGGGAVAAHAAIAPFSMAGLVGTGLAYTPPVQNFIRGLMTAARPTAVRALGDTVRALAPAAAGAAGVLGPIEARARGLFSGQAAQ